MVVECLLLLLKAWWKIGKSIVEDDKLNLALEILEKAKQHNVKFIFRQMLL
jgi:uncharacterized protein YdaU (DUF1376 family)